MDLLGAPHELKKRVEDFAQSMLTGFEVELLYGISEAGQHYAILITRGVWFKVRIFLANEHPNWKTCDFSLEEKEHFENIPWRDVFSTSQHLTMDAARQAAQMYLNFFNRPTEKEAERLVKQAGHLSYISLCIPPADWNKNPEKYFQRGDMLMRPNSVNSFDVATYLGGGDIVHLEATTSTRGRIIPDFVEDKTKKFYLVNSLLRYYKREDLAIGAERQSDSAQQIKSKVLNLIRSPKAFSEAQQTPKVNDSQEVRRQPYPKYRTTDDYNTPTYPTPRCNNYEKIRPPPM